MKIVFLIFFFLPVLWAQHQFLCRSPLLSVGRGDKVDPLLENIKASSPSCIRLSFLLFECHISGIRSICFLLPCAQDAWLAVLRAACWDQCHHVELPSLPRMPRGGASPRDLVHPALVEAKAHTSVLHSSQTLKSWHCHKPVINTYRDRLMSYQGMSMAHS